MRRGRWGVGARLVALRESKGWSQSELAVAVGIDATNLCHLEKDRKPLGRISAGRLARVLGDSVYELLYPGQLGMMLDFGKAQRRDDLADRALAFLRDEARLSVRGGKVQVWEVPVNGHIALVLAPRDIGTMAVAAG